MFFIGSAGSRCERRGPVPNQPCPGCGRRGMELNETYFGLSAFFLPLARLAQVVTVLACTLWREVAFVPERWKGPPPTRE